MKKIIFLAIVSLLAVTATAQQLKTAQGITTITTIEKLKKTFAPIERGFEQSVEVGVSPALDDSGFFLNLDYIAGYRLNNTIFIGGGTGIDYGVDVVENSLAIPIYAVARAYLKPTSRWQPFFGLSTGVIFRIIDGSVDWAWMHKQAGLHLNPVFGVNYRINQKHSCYCSVGYLFKPISLYEYDTIVFNSLDHCLSIKFGFTF